MRGGHAHSGPPPDPDALRGNKGRGDWVHLPAAGRPDPAPGWPLTRQTARELEHWVREWARPQALVWEQLGLAVEVAMYCRTLTAAERPSAATNIRTLVKQQQEVLGLSIPGLARNRWIIDTESVATTRAPGDRSSSKARLTSLDGGAA